MITRVVKIIAVDYDGTLGVADATPNKKNIYSDAVDVLCEFQRRGGEVVLWTCRHGRPLLEVVEACHDAGLDFDAVNENAPRHMRRWLARHPEDIGMKQSPKVYADIYLDDHARFDGQVDWGRLRKELLDGRDPRTKRRYGRAWKRIRDKYAAEHPFCELCFERGVIVPTEEIHHKKPLSEGGTHDRSNLIALCKSCHSRIHALENHEGE